jgi:hypothetical protein
MKRIVFLINLVSLLSINCEPSLSGNLQQEGLIILLDRSDTEVASKVKAAMTLDFHNASQADVVILVSQSIVISSLRKGYIKKDSKAHKAILQKVMKEIGDFYLFIPQKKLETLRRQLNLDKLKNVSFSSLDQNISAHDLGKVAREPLVSILKRFIPVSSEIAWTIYIVGHGSIISEKIADLTIQQFKDLLDFCQQHIKTKLFIYNSCYAGGDNLTKAYQDSEKGVIETYTFPIIVTAITESKTKGSRDDDYKKLYETLFKETDILPDYYTILKDAGFIKYQQNMPQIRMPGSGWFTVEGLNVEQNNKDYMVISKTQALTRQKPLEIKAESRPSGGPRRIIFVYTPVIPFSIKIDTMSLSDTPYFSFMLPGVAQYHFKHINAGKATLDSVVAMLSGIAQLTPRSYQIYIDELTCLFNKAIFEAGQATTFKNCILELSRRSKHEYEAHFNGTLNGQNKALILPFSIDKEGFAYRRYREQKITSDIIYIKKFPPPPSLEEFLKGSESLKAAVLQKQKAAKNRTSFIYLQETQDFLNSLRLGLYLNASSENGTTQRMFSSIKK